MLAARQSAPPFPPLPSPRALPLPPRSQNEDQQQAVVREIFSLLAKRSDAVCNFLEGGRCVKGCCCCRSLLLLLRRLPSCAACLPACLPPRPGPPPTPCARSLSFFGKDTKLIYRHYATLYFVVAVDAAESELGILDLIQVFVEVLDKCFENVCELDLIFHPDRVNYILDEIIMGGMVLDTNIGDVLEAIQEMDKLEKTTKTAGIRVRRGGGEGGRARARARRRLRAHALITMLPIPALPSPRNCRHKLHSPRRPTLIYAARDPHAPH